MSRTLVMLQSAFLALSPLAVCDGIVGDVDTPGEDGQIVEGLSLRLVLPEKATYGERFDAEIQYQNIGKEPLEVFHCCYNEVFPVDEPPEVDEVAIWFEIEGAQGEKVEYCGRKKQISGSCTEFALSKGESRAVIIRHLEIKYGFPGPGRYRCVAKIRTHLYRDGKRIQPVELASNPFNLNLLEGPPAAQNPESTVRSLFEEIESVDDTPTREEILQELLDLGETTQQILPELVTTSESVLVLEAVAEVAKRMNQSAVLHLFLDRLRNSDRHDVLWGYVIPWIIQKWGEEGQAGVVQLLEDPDPEIRQATLKGLTFCSYSPPGHDPVSPVAVVLNRSLDPEIRREFLDGILRIMSERYRSPPQSKDACDLLCEVYWSALEDLKERAEEERQFWEGFAVYIERRYGDRPQRIQFRGQAREVCQCQLSSGETISLEFIPTNDESYPEIDFDSSQRLATLQWSYLTGDKKNQGAALFQRVNGSWKCESAALSSNTICFW